MVIRRIEFLLPDFRQVGIEPASDRRPAPDSCPGTPAHVTGRARRSAASGGTEAGNVQPGSGGGLPWPENANAARPDSAAAATRISHGPSGRRMAAQGRDAERQDRPPGARAHPGRDLRRDRRGHAAVPPGLHAREPVAETAPPRGRGPRRTRHGDRYVSEQQARAELTRVNREIRRLRTELAELEERRAKLISDFGD